VWQTKLYKFYLRVSLSLYCRSPDGAATDQTHYYYGEWHNCSHCCCCCCCHADCLSVVVLCWTCCRSMTHTVHFVRMDSTWRFHLMPDRQRVFPTSPARRRVFCTTAQCAGSTSSRFAAGCDWELYLPVIYFTTCKHTHPCFNGRFPHEIQQILFLSFTLSRKELTPTRDLMAVFHMKFSRYCFYPLLFPEKNWLQPEKATHWYLCLCPSNRLNWRHYVFGLFICACVHAYVRAWPMYCLTGLPSTSSFLAS